MLPKFLLREEIWSRLEELRDMIVHPWMIVGDFNEIIHDSEVRGGELVRSRADQFARVLENCRMVDLGVVGNRDTWFRRQNGRIILSQRLDRAVGDVDWRIDFPDAYM